MLKMLVEKKNQTFIAYCLMVFIILLVLIFKVVPSILAGLLAYVMTKTVMGKLQRVIPAFKTKEKIVGFFIGIVSLALLSLIFFYIIKALNGDKFTELIATLTETLTQAKNFLPSSIAQYIPETVVEIKKTIIETIKTNISSFANLGKSALHEILLVVIGWLIGILIACKIDIKEQTEFSNTWNNIWAKLSDAFKFVVFAQVKVAAFNSFVMSVFLFIICPLAGWNIPYAKSLVIITFLCGLLPIIGNLISNSITFIIALTVSMPAAIGALVLLMLVHKLEYLIISKSLGTDIDSDIWELLIILFTFEILFGVAAMVFSPILYTFFKKEMRRVNWLPS